MSCLYTNRKRLVNELISRLGVNPNDFNNLEDLLFDVFKFYNIVGKQTSQTKQKCICGNNANNGYILENSLGDSFFVGGNCVKYFSSLSTNYKDLFKQCDSKASSKKRRIKEEQNFENLKINKEIYYLRVKYHKIREDKYCNKYYVFSIFDEYEPFIEKLILTNKFIKKQIWKYFGKYYIQIKINPKKNFRFHTMYIYALTITFIENKFFILEKKCIGEIENKERECQISDSE